MNFSVANGAVANGASTSAYINAEATVSASVSIPAPVGEFLRFGTAAAAGGASVVATGTHVLAATVTAAAVSECYADPTLTSQLQASVAANCSVTAFTLRDVYATADIDVAATVVAIAAEALGVATAAVSAAIVPTATRVQFGTAPAAGSVSIAAVESLRTAYVDAEVTATTSVYVESGVNGVYEAFGAATTAAVVSLDALLTHRTTLAFCDLDNAAEAAVVSGGTRIQHATSAVSAATSMAATGRKLSDLTATAACAVGVTAVATRAQPAEAATVTAGASVSLQEANVVYHARAQVVAAAAIVATYGAIRPGRATAVCAVTVSAVQAVRKLVPTAAITVAGVSTAQAAQTVRQGTATAGATAAASGTAVAYKMAQSNVIDATAAFSGTPVRRAQTTALVDTAAGCTIASSGAVRLVLPTVTAAVGVSIVADSVSNPESYDPPERTFIRPGVTFTFTRPEQQFEFSRPASTAAFGRVA